MIWHLVKCPAVKRHWQSKVRGQISLAVKFFKSWLPIKNPRSNVTAVKCPGVKCPAVKCYLPSSFSNLGCRSKIPRSNVTAVKCPAVKRHWRSMVPRSNVTCGQVFLILVADQKSRGQMSLRSNVPRSNVPRSNVTGGQRSWVKCHLRSSFSNLCCWSKIPQSNVTAVKCPAVKRH